MTMLEHALEYLDAGFCPLPTKKGVKYPRLEKWGPYQEKKPTKEEIKEWWTKWPDSNIAILTGMISKLAVVDMDSEEGIGIMKGILKNSQQVPTAMTPSGGKHLWFYSEDPKLRNNVNEKIQCDFRANGGLVIAPPSINGNGKGYAWEKGLSIFEIESPKLPDTYYKYIKNALSLYRCDKSELQSVTSVTGCDRFFVKGRRDTDLFHAARCFVWGGWGKEYTQQALETLAKNCKPEFPPEEIKIKIQSAIENVGRRQGQLSHEVEEWVALQKRYFSVTESYSELHIVTKEDKANARQVIKRLKDKGIIEPTGNRSGQYRKKDLSFEAVTEFPDTSNEGIKMKFPLMIEYYAKIFASNIIIVSGEKSAGKTAFCLSLARLNMHLDMPIRYISSEFGADELLERLTPMQHIVSPKEWINRIEFNRFRGEPQDALLPDGLNIIDYLEVRDGEFFKIGSQIDRIFDKINNGVAVIALQTNPGQEIARGGAQTLDKSRLYISLNRKDKKNHATIVDCKNWENKTYNPNRTYCEYKLGQGYHFERIEHWKRK